MGAHTSHSDDSRAHRIQQAVKWTVYGLLIVNFGFYIFEDWSRAIHTLDASSTFLDWTTEFATSIDESAWFVLLFMLELETYILGDKQWKGWVAYTVRGLRILCIVMIAHTVYAWTDTVIDYSKEKPVENVTSLCEMTDQRVAYVYNLEYTSVTADNCASLSSATQFYWLGDDPLVVTYDGLKLELNLAWADWVEAVAWLLILILIELVVRLQDRGVTDGLAITWAGRSKIALYILLIGIAGYWATLSHWLYVWDELLWIGGFAAIEMNVSQWRDEIVDEVVGA